ncbi:hypothetical protein ACGFJ5_04605 [Micromonospora echinaurantiaca]|uniref:hypothetical protein n=1 Tax=Micromonospora echinaurantiaca TaxID=47857 RepID=UPI00371C8A94
MQNLGRKASFPDSGRRVVGDADDDLVGSGIADRLGSSTPACGDDAAHALAEQLDGPIGDVVIAIRLGHDTPLPVPGGTSVAG